MEAKTETWEEQADKILAEEHKKGNPIRWDVNPDSNVEDCARDFVLMHHALKTGQCKEVKGVIL